MAKLNLHPWRWDDSGRPCRQAGADTRTRHRWPMPLVLLLALAAFTPSELSAEPLVDSTGRTQEIATPVTVVVPAGAPAQVLLQALAPEKLGALVEGFAPDHAVFVDPRLVTLPQVAMLTRSSAPGDVAAVAALKPGLVVDYGSTAPRYVAAEEKIATELKVPAVLFSGRLGDVAAVLRALAKPLDETARGELLVQEAARVLDRLKPFAALPEGERVAVYVARGSDGLSALRAGTSFDEPLRLAGARNPVAGGGGTFKRMSVDDVVRLQPAVVVVSDRDALSSPLHAALPASTIWVVDAGEPYKVLTGPPSINRLVGASALATILHSGKSADDSEATRLETVMFSPYAQRKLPSPLQVQH